VARRSKPLLHPQHLPVRQSPSSIYSLKPAKPKSSPFGGFGRPSARPPAQNKPDSSAADNIQDETSNGSLPILGVTVPKPADGIPYSSAFGATNVSANANAASPAVLTPFGTTTATAGSLFWQPRNQLKPLLVGVINWTMKAGQSVRRGDDLGYFAYGGSTCIAVFLGGTI
jgi:hypothetical protein